MKKERKSHKHIKFQKLIREGIIELGATQTGAGVYQYTLQTALGELLITMHDSDLVHPSTIYSVYTRFKDVERASIRLSCNPFSGKWNFHYFVKDNDPEEIAKEILFEITHLEGYRSDKVPVT